MQGHIFNIQTYSIHDGPGIRTTVFLKGCPLRCIWCQNPESQSFIPQLMVYKTLCSGCGACAEACPAGAIQLNDGKTATNRMLCVDCGACTIACPNSARMLAGTKVNAVETAEKAYADKLFFDSSGGGVTLSGGEILSQPEFVTEILRECKEKGVNTAIETCGYGNWESFRNILEYTDLVLYDFKHMDPVRHKELTGVDNALILDNAVKVVHEIGKELIGRIPVIPDYNDSKDNIEKTAQFIAKKLKPGIKVHLLPFNPLAESKSASLEISDPIKFINPPDEKLLELKKILEDNGLVGVIGG